MAHEDERSLEKRPEINLAKLSKGGVIVGKETGIQGSLMNVSGMALERITRERVGIPPELRLPERAVYFLDPATSRMVMISNREDMGRGSERAGLFAEIVEMDEEGKPHYRLSTSEVLVPSDQYQLVAVGPNKYGLPPSHIEIVEEGSLIRDEKAKAKKEQFVSWNQHLANLQVWMNEAKPAPGEDLDTFLKKFESLNGKRRVETSELINRSFPQGWQGFSPHAAPINVIIGDDKNREMLRKASLDAGLYPVFWDLKKIVESLMELETNPNSRQILERHWALGPDCKILTYITHIPAIMTFDMINPGINDPIVQKASGRGVMNNPGRIGGAFRGNNPIFSVVELWAGTDEPEGEEDYEDKEPWKEEHGLYGVRRVEKQYRQLLTKLKADLLLTMFLRGGAPLTK